MSACGILHGAHDARRLLGARQPEVRVDGDADDVERGEGLVVDVERAVALDVDLGAGQDADAAELLVERADRLHLATQLARVGAARHRQARRCDR